MKLKINNRLIGSGCPVYIVAEISANHNQNFEEAVRIIKIAKEAGADAVKLQTYTPDTMTIDCENEFFRIKDTIWKGRNLYQLYREAFTPWEWQSDLKKNAEKIGLDFFSTPFDETAVDFLEKLDVPVYKIASFELIDTLLLKKVGATKKPVIMSTGMATLAEIDEAVKTIRLAGNSEIALLKCTSSYPALPKEMNLLTIPHLSSSFNVPVGLSDHTMETTVPVAAVALGATIIEKHLTLSRTIPGPDSIFSLEPQEFKEMVLAVRNTEKALGRVNYEPTEQEQNSRVFRRSLFAIRNIAAGEKFTKENVRSIRPGYGLAPIYMDIVLGKRAAVEIKRGTPLNWNFLSE